MKSKFSLNLGYQGLHLSGNASLIYDPAGPVAGAIETLRDITERKHMGADLRNSNIRRIKNV
jgi:signal transduction histidine kinase